MKSVEYIDRATGKLFKEKVCGEELLRFLYGGSTVGRALSTLLAGSPLFSKLVGMAMRSGHSRKRILPFIEKYEIDAAEFLDPVESFSTFNDFFIRKLKPSVRPIDPDPEALIIPADGRYLFFEGVKDFVVKGVSFDIDSFLNEPSLAERYRRGSMAVARLAPVDYHRFHFPCASVASKARLINGALYSVNPIAIGRNLSIFWENKRLITELSSDHFGTILYAEVGATSVGTICETYTPGRRAERGEEKGYFSFGGSSLVLFFEEGRVRFSRDLLEAQKRPLEIRCLLGQKMGSRAIL